MFGTRRQRRLADQQFAGGQRREGRGDSRQRPAHGEICLGVRVADQTERVEIRRRGAEGRDEPGEAHRHADAGAGRRQGRGQRHRVGRGEGILRGGRSRSGEIEIRRRLSIERLQVHGHQICGVRSDGAGQRGRAQQRTARGRIEGAAGCAGPQRSGQLQVLAHRDVLDGECAALAGFADRGCGADGRGHQMRVRHAAGVGRISQSVPDRERVAGARGHRAGYAVEPGAGDARADQHAGRGEGHRGAVE